MVHLGLDFVWCWFGTLRSIALRKPYLKIYHTKLCIYHKISGEWLQLGDNIILSLIRMNLKMKILINFSYFFTLDYFPKPMEKEK